MSISVDDLVASLNSHHIDQEALDLAALQAQLTKALFSHPPSADPAPPSSRSGSMQPSNTPTSRTPSSSFSWDCSEAFHSCGTAVAGARRRGSMIDDRMVARCSEMENGDEDERIMADLFCPPTSATMRASPPSHFPPRLPSGAGAAYVLPDYPSHNTHGSPSQVDLLAPSGASIFTTTDPFYLAQLQASQRSGGPSLLTNGAWPPPQAPFVLGEQASSPAHAFSHRVAAASETEAHRLYVWY